jgi:hypothetical protein
MIKRLAAMWGICGLAGCSAVPNAVGNDSYATVALGDRSQAVAQAYCYSYGKVARPREQDPAHDTITYDCIVPGVASVKVQ